jgi:hypothetical protein
MVPEALSGSWFLALMVGLIALAFLVMCQILLTKDPSLSVWTKVGTGIAVLVVLLLSALWVRMTSGLPSEIRLQSRGTTHTVALKWRPSSSQVAGYNVYRSMTPAGNYVQINSSLVKGVTFTDNSVESGVTYYYVTRAVDALGHESVDSNEARAAIPWQLERRQQNAADVWRKRISASNLESWSAKHKMPASSSWSRYELSGRWRFGRKSR